MEMSINECLIATTASSSPVAARELLDELTSRLDQVKQESPSPEKLAQDYYLPMFEAAVTLQIFSQADALRQEIVEDNIPDCELPRWWSLNFELDFCQQRFGKAEEWCQRGMIQLEDGTNENGSAIIFHQLGMIAQNRHDLDAAEQWYRMALEAATRAGNDSAASITYHQMGMLALEQHDLVAAEEWYDKSLCIKESDGNGPGLVLTCHQLGIVAQQEWDLEAAESWYNRARQLSEEIGFDRAAANAYHQLGRIAMERDQFDDAELWYKKALDITKREGDEHGTCCIYNQLGTMAEERADAAGAETWYRQALESGERRGDLQVEALSCGQLGNLAGMQNKFEDCGNWLVRSILTFVKSEDSRNAAHMAESFLHHLRQAPMKEQDKLRAMWHTVGLGRLSDGAEDTD